MDDLIQEAHLNMGEKLLRDPIHDLIIFDLNRSEDQLLLALMDTPEFQRLRRIRQMGMAGLVFHGAEHSRFTHSIGVMHLMRRAITRLDPDRSLEPLLHTAALAAALLHDIGHGPFSHVMEDFFGYRHERWSKRVILDEHTKVYQLLYTHDPKLPQLVVNVMEKKIKPRWVGLLLSSQLDVDRSDYLMRDSHMTGVKYGVFDFERLLLMMRISDDGEKIYIAPKGLLPVEKYLQSRYQMYRQVYFHKTCAAAEAMLMAILKRAQLLCQTQAIFADQVPQPLKAFFQNTEALTAQEYLEVDDAVFLYALSRWAKCDDSILADLCDRLLNRRLFKTIEIQNFDENDLDHSMRINRAKEFLLEQGFDPDYYLLFGKSSDTPYQPYSSHREKSQDETILIQNDFSSGNLQDVQTVSPTIKAFTESPYTIWRVYFPNHHLPKWRQKLKEIFVE